VTPVYTYRVIPRLRADPAPLTAERMIQLLLSIDTSTRAGRRDVALLLVGWYGAMRRSEIAAIAATTSTSTPMGPPSVSRERRHHRITPWWFRSRGTRRRGGVRSRHCRTGSTDLAFGALE
jgi:hypothetical protein